MNIGNINPLRGPEDNSPVHRAPMTPAQFMAATGMSLPKDMFRAVSNPTQAEAAIESEEAPAAESRPERPRKSLSEARENLKSGMGRLKDQSEDDKAALREIARTVDSRTDLLSAEKEWLFASEVLVYSADQAMKMTSPEKHGQPWSPKQEERLKALSATFEGARDTVEALSPKLEKPDTGKETFATSPLGLTLKGEALANVADDDPLVAELPAKYRVAPTQNQEPPPVDNTPPPEKPDPLVKIWESRRQESQEMFNDYKTLMQKTTEWKQRILASRIAFFWRVYGMHNNFLSGAYRRG